jgi:hypothetical protein
MSSTLPEPIAAYFAAANRHDVDATLGPFSKTAVVIDEGRERTGLAAIREWIEETTVKYRPSAAVTSVTENAGDTVVMVRMSGTFPGSPIDIRYAFTLKDQSITRLEIH